MKRELLWLGAAATAATVTTLPSYAVRYLTVEQAQKTCFPSVDSFTASHVIFTPAQKKEIQSLSGAKVGTKGQQVWKAQSGGKLVGYFFVDYVIGKHLLIDYAVALSPDGTVRQVEILEYRESYGGEIRNESWRNQFKGKTLTSPLKLNSDITNISGATLSCRHVTEGIKKITAIHKVCLTR